MIFSTLYRGSLKALEDLETSHYGPRVEQQPHKHAVNPTSPQPPAYGPRVGASVSTPAAQPGFVEEPVWRRPFHNGYGFSPGLFNGLFPADSPLARISAQLSATPSTGQAPRAQIPSVLTTSVQTPGVHTQGTAAPYDPSEGRRRISALATHMAREVARRNALAANGVNNAAGKATAPLNPLATPGVQALPQGQRLFLQQEYLKEQAKLIAAQHSQHQSTLQSALAPMVPSKASWNSTFGNSFAQAAQTSSDAAGFILRSLGYQAPQSLSNSSLQAHLTDAEYTGTWEESQPISASEQPVGQIGPHHTAQTFSALQLADSHNTGMTNNHAQDEDKAVSGTVTQLSTNVPSASNNSEYSETFLTFMKNLAPREGGIADHPNDDGGLTNKGVSQKQLDRLRKLDRWAHLPQTTDKLTDEQIYAIYYLEYYIHPKVDKIEQIPGLTEAAPKFVEQVFDSTILHGQKHIGTWIQEAIFEVTGVDLRETNLQTGEQYFDGNVGPRTRQAIQSAVEDGSITAIHNLIVEKRLQLMRRHPDYPDFKNGWEVRAKSFLQIVPTS